MIEHRGHSIMVYDHNELEMFSIGDISKGKAVVDLHSQPVYTRDELIEIASAIMMITNDTRLWS